MTPTPLPLLVGMPPALQLAVSLARRAHHLRALPPVPCDPDAGLVQAQQVAAESSIALLLLILDPWLDPPPPDRLVSITDHLAVALRAVSNVLTTETPPDVGAPLLSNQIQRHCALAGPVAAVAVQATVLLVLAAIADGAMQVVVSLPRSPAAQVVLEIQTDAAGLAGAPAGSDFDRLTDWLQTIGGSVIVEQKRRAWWTTRIWLPAHPLPDAGAAGPQALTN